MAPPNFENRAESPPPLAPSEEATVFYFMVNQYTEERDGDSVTDNDMHTQEKEQSQISFAFGEEKLFVTKFSQFFSSLLS